MLTWSVHWFSLVWFGFGFGLGFYELHCSVFLPGFYLVVCFFVCFVFFFSCSAGPRVHGDARGRVGRGGRRRSLLLRHRIGAAGRRRLGEGRTAAGRRRRRRRRRQRRRQRRPRPAPTAAPVRPLNSTFSFFFMFFYFFFFFFVLFCFFFLETCGLRNLAIFVGFGFNSSPMSVFTGFYWILPGFTGFYWLLWTRSLNYSDISVPFPSLKTFRVFLPRFTGFYRVVTEFCLDLIGFYRVFMGWSVKEQSLKPCFTGL